MGATIEQYMRWLSSEVPHQDNCDMADPQPEFENTCFCLTGKVLDKLLDIGELAGGDSDDVELPDGFQGELR